MKKKHFLRLRSNVSLKNYTTYRIGGPAKFFIKVRNEEELLESLKEAKKRKIPFFILGAGSNLLVSDKGFKGLVIKMEMDRIKIEGEEILVEAGKLLTPLSYFLAQKGLSGLEWVAGIPGTIGGGIYGHIQAMGGKISDVVKKVRAINVKNFDYKEFSNKECCFSDKSSIFKEKKEWIILGARLKLRKGNPTIIKKKIQENIIYRKNHHPLDSLSAGSVFVNPEIKIKDSKLLREFPELKEFNKKGFIPAGYLIEKCGLKGKRIGGAKISEKHANFILNVKRAKAEDVLALIKLAQRKVKKRFNINLVPEIQLLGF